MIISPIEFFFLILSVILYGLSFAMLWREAFNGIAINHKRLTIISFLAGGLHFIGSLSLIFSGSETDFSLFTSGSMIFAVTSLLITLSALRKPVHILLLIIQPIAITLIIASLIFNTSKLTTLSPGVTFHILFSVLSYGLITIAAAFALVLSYASYKLKHKQIGALGPLIPPLETTEKMLFEVVLAGELLLTASIVTGLIYLDNFFGQQLAHKTFFSLLSWIIFATLLAGHHFFGWRGAKAMKWTIAGFITLLLAYVGSKFVLELLLR